MATMTDDVCARLHAAQHEANALNKLNIATEILYSTRQHGTLPTDAGLLLWRLQSYVMMASCSLLDTLFVAYYINFSLTLQVLNRQEWHLPLAIR